MKPRPEYKMSCDECDWVGSSTELLEAQNPFDPRPGETISGCPRCKSVECCSVACDEPNCIEVSTCGFGTPEGYRRACSKHYAEAQKRLAHAEQKPWLTPEYW